MTELANAFSRFYASIGLRYLARGQALMILIGLGLLLLGALRRRRPALPLIALGFGILAGNMPFSPVEEAWAASAEGYGIFSVLNFLLGPNLLPALVFFGIGAATDFSPLIASPRLALLGAGAQLGIFAAMVLGHVLLPLKAAAIAAAAGGAHGLLAIYAAAALDPRLLAAAALAALAAARLAPWILGPVARRLTTPAERAIRMAPPRPVSRRQRLLFPAIAFPLCVAIVPAARVLLAMLFLGNLLRESSSGRIVPRLGRAATGLLAAALAFAVGLVTYAGNFLTWATLGVFLIALLGFVLAAGWGILMAKMMNVFTPDKINPLVVAGGAAPASRAARIAQHLADGEDPGNPLFVHARASNLAAQIALALTIGIFIGMIG